MSWWKGKIAGGFTSPLFCSWSRLPWADSTSVESTTAPGLTCAGLVHTFDALSRGMGIQGLSGRVLNV